MEGGTGAPVPVAAGRGGGHSAIGARLPRAGAGSAAQGHGGKEGARRDGSSGHGAAGALPAVPGALPAAVPAPRPALTMLRRVVRAVPAARCGGARRGAAAAAIPAAALSYRWEGLVSPRPLIWVHLHASGSPPFGGRGSLAGSSRLRRNPEVCGPKLLLLLCPKEGRGSCPGCRQEAWGPSLRRDGQC